MTRVMVGSRLHVVIHGKSQSHAWSDPRGAMSKDAQ